MGITRCVAVCGVTSDMEPKVPMATAAGSAVASDDEVNSAKYAIAVASLVRLGRTPRFRQAVKTITTTLSPDTEEFPAQLVAALAALADALGKDLAEPDWWRILDAVLLIATYPAAP